ncbi:MAG TPA: hypothetical protein VF092_04195 [Longimicrobium sp.]
MSLYGPHVRRPLVLRVPTAAKLAAAGLVALLMAGCADAPRRLTGPESAELPGARGAPSTNTAIVACKLAVRMPSGSYRTKELTVRAPRHIADPAGKTVTHGYREWVTGLPDPVRLVMCEVPATPAAEEWFRTVFPGVQASVAGSAPGARSPLATLVTAADAFTTSPAVVYDGLGRRAMVECEPYEQLAVDCSGGDTGGGEWEGPPPPDEEPGDAAIDASGDPVAAMAEGAEGGGAAAAIPITCAGQTDNPHRSTHVPGMVNVIGRTTCSAPIPISVSVALQRQSCVWIFCWWSSRASGYNATTGTFVQANAASFCQTGYWRGRSTHSATPGFGYWPPSATWSTARTSYISYC